MVVDWRFDLVNQASVDDLWLKRVLCPRLTLSRVAGFLSLSSTSSCRGPNLTWTENKDNKPSRVLWKRGSNPNPATYWRCSSCPPIFARIGRCMAISHEKENVDHWKLKNPPNLAEKDPQNSCWIKSAELLLNKIRNILPRNEGFKQVQKTWLKYCKILNLKIYNFPFSLGEKDCQKEEERWIFASLMISTLKPPVQT